MEVFGPSDDVKASQQNDAEVEVLEGAICVHKLCFYNRSSIATWNRFRVTFCEISIFQPPSSGMSDSIL